MVTCSVAFQEIAVTHIDVRVYLSSSAEESTVVLTRQGEHQRGRQRAGEYKRCVPPMTSTLPSWSTVAVCVSLDVLLPLSVKPSLSGANEAARFRELPVARTPRQDPK